MSYTHFPTRFGKYVLLDRINSGGMAEVYRAKVTGAEQFQRLVAIKCMLPQLNEDLEFTTMFIDEAKLAAQLAHANIVQIYELGRLGEQLYIAMELINGRDLRHIIKRAHAQRKPMSIGFAAYVMSKAAEGLDFAHRKHGVNGQPLNLVHRDVSPQNILVSYDGEVKVVDFGIAKAEVRDTATRAGVLKGKLAYMAPEQVMGQVTDRRADIFALGAVLYEIMAGRALFKGESDVSIMDKVRNAVVPRLAATLADVPAELDDVLQKALARSLDTRFAWASDFAEALAPLLITHRSIFGAKQAREFMAELYAEDIAQQAVAQRRYLEITEEDCVEQSGPNRQPGSLQVFESTGALKGETAASIGDNAMQALAASLDQPTRLSESQEHSLPREVTPPDGTVMLEHGPTTSPPAPMGWTGTPMDPALSLDAMATQSMNLDEAGFATALQTGPAQAQPVLRPVALGTRPPSSSSRSILVGLIAATIVTLGAVGAVVIHSKRGGSRTVTPMSVEPAGGNTPRAPTPPVPVAPPAVNPPPAATPVVSPGPTPTPAAVPAVAGGDEPSTDRPGPRAKALKEKPTKEKLAKEKPAKEKPAKEKPAKEKPARETLVEGSKLGCVTVKAIGVKAAQVFVNGKLAGSTPLLRYKVKLGASTIKVVEEADGDLGRVKLMDINVEPANNCSDPLLLVVPM